MAERYGARPEAWDEWCAIGAGDDLLPAVANPAAEIAPTSSMQGIGKTPSRYNRDRKVIGIGKWTSYVASSQEIERWKAEPDYALSVITRQFGAVDVDVGDRDKAKAIREAIVSFLGPCPVRYREGTGKFLIPFRRSFAMPKRVLQVSGGMIEVLGDGQQFIADGYHQSGHRYQWNSAALEDMQELSEEKYLAFCAMLEMCFGTSEWKVAREKRDVQGQSTYTGEDPVADWLADNWTVRDSGADGQLFIECPFELSHSPGGGATATAYFPAGTGGYAQGHFVCLHAHCAGRADRDFLDATGFAAGEFADLFHAPTPGVEGGSADRLLGDAPDAGRSGEGAKLTLVRDGKGRIEPSADNLVKLCSRPDQIGKHLAYDEFKADLVWAPADHPVASAQWRLFGDTDYVDIRIELERRGMKAMSHELLRSAVGRVAQAHSFDTAKEWLGRLQWDGIERVESFCTAGWGWVATPYARAVGRYVWTALAGRVIQPGVQCDMAPILVGPQGLGKTSAIKAMAPDEEFYVTIPLDGHDTDTSRRLRGKLIGELEELRGLNSRSVEVIKAWITRTTEGWIPKFKEFENAFKRRLIFFGSTNDDEFLNDPTGERRWLPGRCGDLDVQWIKDNREQLWAEGAAKFLLGGVDWEDAQTLGASEHHEFKVHDSWEGPVERWLVEKQISGVVPIEVGHFTMEEVLAGAVNVATALQDRGKEMRMAKVLKHLGWARKRLPAGPDGKRPWAYVKEEG